MAELRLLPSTTKTAAEWSALGYRICKGEKHIGRNEAGICVFSRSQVWHPVSEASLNDDWEMEHDTFTDAYHGNGWGHE